MAPELKPLGVSIDDAIRLSGLGRSTIYERINDGSLRSVRIGGRRLILYSSLEEMFASAEAVAA